MYRANSRALLQLTRSNIYPDIAMMWVMPVSRTSFRRESRISLRELPFP